MEAPKRRGRVVAMLPAWPTSPLYLALAAGGVFHADPSLHLPPGRRNRRATAHNADVPL